MNDIDKEKIVSQLIRAFPAKPDGLYEQSIWLNDIIEVLSSIIGTYQKENDSIMNQIVEDKIMNDNLELVYPVTIKRTVNLNKLKENTELFNNLVFIKETDLSKLIPRCDLREIIIDKVGLDKANKYITCNITDLESAVGKNNAVQYIDVATSRKNNPLIVKKGEYHKDHYKLENLNELIYDYNIEV